MAESAPQQYGNHPHRPTATAVAAFFSLLAVVIIVVQAIRVGPGLEFFGTLSLAIAVMTLVLISRTYTVRLQDRIIRMEMDARLRRLGLEHELAALTMRQLVALRFASDREMPSLARRAVAETLSSDQIKRAVTEWQPDRMRT